MASCSSVDVTRAMCGQPERLTRNFLRINKWRKIWWKVILYNILIFKVSFYSTSVFYTLSRLFFRLGFCFLCADLTVQVAKVKTIVAAKYPWHGFMLDAGNTLIPSPVSKETVRSLYLTAFGPPYPSGYKIYGEVHLSPYIRSGGSGRTSFLLFLTATLHIFWQTTESGKLGFYHETLLPGVGSDYLTPH